MRINMTTLLLLVVSSVSWAAEPQKMAPVLQPFVDSNVLAGAVVLVADPIKTLDLEAVGWMDVAAKKPMRTDSLFWIASQSKPLTCTGLMMLVDDGKISVDDPVEKYLPEFKGLMYVFEKDDEHQLLKKPSRPMLVRDVMCHVSGLPGSTAVMSPTLDAIPLAITVKANTMSPLQTEPGAKYTYSNPGINTVGRLIEVVSGMPYEKFMDERLFQPLGMTDTTFWPNEEQLSRLAKSYKPNADKSGLEETTISALRYPLNDRARYPFPGGGLFATAVDLSRFYRMIANNGDFDGRRILAEKSIAQMTTDQTGELKASYGFGFSTNGRMVSHGGAYNTNSRLDRDNQLITVFLVQHAGWVDEGKKILPAFQKAATDAYAPKQAAAKEKTVAVNEPATKLDWPVKVDRVRFIPAPDREKAMAGGKITGSNVSATTGYQILAEITSVPVRGEWNELQFTNTKPYRWVRYEAPPGSRGNIAELEFYSGSNKLSGSGFGSAGSLGPGGQWRTAFDGKNETWFNSNNIDGQYVGIDLGDRAATARVNIDPAGGDKETPQVVTMKSATPGATIRYTVDGTTPGRDDGQVYSAPFTIDKNATLIAVAFSDQLAPSTATIATIWIGKPSRPPMNSFHVGNSLTGNASRYSSFIRTAGGVDKFPAYLIGGSLTFKLWNESQGKDKARWDETYAKAVHPLDYFTMQPRDFDISQEADHCIRFIKLLQEKSPDMQPWLYAEWVEMGRNRPSDKGEVPSSQMKKTFPALTWEESMGAMMLYNEEVQHQIVTQYTEGKRVRILPTAVAFGWARNLIDRGQFPGVTPGETGFYETLFDDQVHVNGAGCYLVGLTWYAALHGESPEGKLLPVGTNLTPDQARLLQRLAWDVIQNYPDCGVFAEGTTPVQPPQFKYEVKRPNNVSPVTLSSTTPGAWFRYTLDGTVPTRTNGYIYCGVVSLRPGMTLKAVAFKNGMKDSPVTESAIPAVSIP